MTENVFIDHGQIAQRLRAITAKAGAVLYGQRTWLQRCQTVQDALGIGSIGDVLSERSGLNLRQAFTNPAENVAFGELYGHWHGVHDFFQHLLGLLGFLQSG